MTSPQPEPARHWFDAIQLVSAVVSIIIVIGSAVQFFRENELYIIFLTTGIMACLLLLNIFLIRYVWHLRKTRAEAYIAIKQQRSTLENSIAMLQLELDDFIGFYKAMVAVDTAVAAELAQHQRHPRARLVRSMDVLMNVCLSILLPQYPGVYEKRALFLEYDAQSQMFNVLASAIDRSTELRHQLHRDNSLAGKALRTLRVICVNNVDDTTDPHYGDYLRIGEPPRYKSIICIPVHIDGWSIGVLVIECIHTNAFQPSDLPIIDRLKDKALYIYRIFYDLSKQRTA